MLTRALDGPDRWRDNRWTPPVTSPRIVAHRGASALAPENSVDAFARARADAADGVELDVLLCRTGEVVVFHDDDLARLGGRPDRIDALGLADVRAVRLRSGAAIPLLAEAFEACGPDVLVNVELKSEGVLDPRMGELCDAVARVLDGVGGAPRTLVSSFNPLALVHWTRRRPDVPVGLLFEREAARPLREAWAARFLHPFAMHPEHVLCDPARVAAWRARGHAVNVWTVDDPQRLRALAAMGVDGVITNNPAAARAALQARA